MNVQRTNESDDKPFLSGTAKDQPTAARDLMLKRVLMILAEGFEDVEVVVALDVLGWTRYRARKVNVEVDTTGFHEAVSGAFGTTLSVDKPIDTVNPSDYDALVIPGGFHNLGYDEIYDTRVRTIAKALHRRGCPIATMCVGVIPVAEAGLLEGGTATTYALSSRHDNRERLRELGCTPSDEPVVEWDNIISCSGPAYSEHVACLLLEKLVGAEVADEVHRYRRGMSN